MKTPNFIFEFFIIVFILFILSSINYWNLVATNVSIEGREYIQLKYASLLAVISCIFIIIKYINRIRFKGIHLVCLLWFLFMPIIIYLNKGALADYVFTLLWPVFFEVSFVLSYINTRRVRILKNLFLLIFIFVLFYFIMAIFTGSGGQSNTIFFPLLTLPWLLCINRKYIRLILFVILSFAVLFSMKRSGILIIIFCWLIYGLLIINRGKNKVIAIISVFILFSIAFFSFDIIDDFSGGRITERLNKEETNEGSGRLAIYEITIDMQKKSSKTSWLFGHGHFGVYNDSPFGISAHNDFLEVLYDYGLFIMILYLCLWGYVIKRAIYLYKIKSFYLFPYLASVIIFIIMSAVSHLILYTSYFNFLVIFWGCIEGLIASNKKEKMYLASLKRL